MNALFTSRLCLYQELVGCKKMGDIVLETLEASRPAAVLH